MNPKPHWDKALFQMLRSMGVDVETTGSLIGLVAEHRQIADQEGYSRGYNNGFIDGAQSNVQSTQNSE